MRKTVKKNRRAEEVRNVGGVFKFTEADPGRHLCSCEFRTATGREVTAFLKLQNKERESL